MDLPYDPLDSLQNNGIAFIDLIANTDPDLTVPGCGGWTVLDLAQHQGDVWNFWSNVVSMKITDRGLLQTIADSPKPKGDLLIDWLGTTHNAIYTALVDGGVDQPVWTWTGANRDTAWVRRRMAIETAIHRADAARAGGTPFEISTAMAADGIDEFLMWFAGNERREGELRPGGTVHLHCTDTTEADTAGGEWFVSSLKEPSCTFTREHRKGDAAIRGRAHDLLMWVWRRSTDGVEVIGDEKVARRFRAYSDLD